MIEILADANATLLAEGNATQAVEQAKGITGSIQAGLGCLGAAIAVGMVGMKGAEAVGRNPDASTPILVQSIIGMALAEAVAFYSLFL
jgi:F-type H+-transporting ATPase subunit c|tara:strand:- start:777 stop:1040 length:264 start_codon:yes stop_codon:yes gene_type:complete